jgi:hypothetical protein
VQEEIYFMTPGLGGTQHPFVRADVAYFTTPNHGAVFATGSIAWGSALPSRNFDNSASRLTKNVVDAFMKEGPLPGTGFEPRRAVGRLFLVIAGLDPPIQGCRELDARVEPGRARA